MTGGPVETAAVYLHGQVVGRLWSSEGTHRFQLIPEYLELSQRPVLGQVFEERPGRLWQQAQLLPPWFSNLLPEHRLRDLIAKERGINPLNEFRLITALGADLPGAVKVVPIPGPPRNFESVPHKGRFEAQPVPTMPESEPRSTDDNYLIRFSLAGVQLKLSMVWSSNTLMLPGKGKLADHLVKLPSRRFPQVPENEFSMMIWAGKAGINVPECTIHPSDRLATLPPGFEVLKSDNVYVVKRFDRGQCQASDRRIHMEDLNQVLNQWPRDKYRGIGFERLGRIILALCGQDDYLEYIRRLTFCVAIGNEDAHLKNWTIWYPNRIRPRLSPAYDLVSTIQFLDLDRETALRFGRTKKASRIDMRTMERIAEGSGVDPQLVKQTVQQTLVSMRDSWPRIVSDLPVGGGFIDTLRSYQRSVPLVQPFAI